MCRWDWYQTTLSISDPQESGLIGLFLKTWDLSDYVPAGNRNGYTRGGAIVRGSERLCTLLWGGNPGVNVTSTSEHAPALARALSEAFPLHHSPTRVDACVDWVEQGLFDEIARKLIRFSTDNRLAINQQGDWVRGQARTLYIGSKSSPVRLVLYEKGYEQGGDAPREWVRLEVRVRPKREHRAQVARWEPIDAFGSAWVPDAMTHLGWDDLERHSVGTVWRQSDDERAFAYLCKQYGNLFKRLRATHGSYEVVGSIIGERMCASEHATSKHVTSEQVTNKHVTGEHVCINTAVF